VKHSRGHAASRRNIFGWTRDSYALLSSFVLVILLILYFWRPLAVEYLSYIDWQGRWWLQLDWLLIGIFLVMTFLIMWGANLKKDIWIVFVGFIGGLVIESWGTQTAIWTYYTLERPPLWIIPAWPIASLSIDRLLNLLGRVFPQGTEQRYKWIYWLVFTAFYGLMLGFVAPTLDKPLTLFSLGLTAFIVLTPTDYRTAVLTFAAGAGLGYFLERWGTTRQCWMYYTGETPPFFAVLAHGMAAVAFWRTVDVLRRLTLRLRLSNQTANPEAGD